MTDGVLVQVDASTGRRVSGLAVLGALALAILGNALLAPGVPALQRLLLIVLGLLVCAMALALKRATERALVLTEAGLSDSAGTLLASMDQIEAVDRGTFAFKPSNGFLLRLRDKGPRRFLPGLYWQYGRRIGVGGVLRASETKQMADVIAIALADRAARAAGDTPSDVPADPPSGSNAD